MVGSSTQAVARLEIRPCNASTTQQFAPEVAGGGFFRLRSVLSGMCLDVRGMSPFDGAEVIQFGCNAGGPVAEAS